MYPLTGDFIPEIDQFLSFLHNRPNIKVATNNMSTQVFGEAEAVFQAVNQGILKAYESLDQCPFVIKVLKGDVSDNVVKDYV